MTAGGRAKRIGRRDGSVHTGRLGSGGFGSPWDLRLRAFGRGREWAKP